MAKQTKDKTWISQDWFQAGNPHPCTITAVETENGQYGEQLVLYLRSELSGDIGCMSIFKKNKNTLIDKFGDDDVNWIGKKIKLSSLTEGDKTIKEIGTF